MQTVTGSTAWHDKRPLDRLPHGVGGVASNPSSFLLLATVARVCYCFLVPVLQRAGCGGLVVCSALHHKAAVTFAPRPIFPEWEVAGSLNYLLYALIAIEGNDPCYVVVKRRPIV